MKNKNLTMLSLLVTFLFSVSLVSFANAADEVAPSSIPPVEPKAAMPPDFLGDFPKSEFLLESTFPDSPVSSKDEILYTTQDEDLIVAKDGQGPSAEEANLISERAEAGADNIWVVLGLMAVLTAGLSSVLGVVLYRRVPIEK